jgi:23S rRNA (cytosine1962-C5)-methyltransferase
MKERCVILKPGKEKAIQHRHHWIFSGAVAQYPDYQDGDILPVHSSKGELLGSAYFNRKSSIVGRMIAFDATPPLEAMMKSIDGAVVLRELLFDKSKTNAYRLINGEGDNLPGLVVDRYDDVFVLQFATLGMERQKQWLVDYLTKKLKPRALYDKSLLPSRKDEGLAQTQGTLYGSDVDEINIVENGLHFSLSIKEGQKTGFFLDHREVRDWVRSLATDKRVLNCFSYSGAFTVYALAGGAAKVDSVDISEGAIEMAKRNVAANGYALERQGFYTKDVFEFLRNQHLNYNLIILDPPAFAKRQKDVIAACRGYKDINRLAIQKMPPKSLLLTCSCSYHVDKSLFQKVIFQAALEASRKVRIVGVHRMAADHPINIYHPEGDYLKSLLLYVE